MPLIKNKFSFTYLHLATALSITLYSVYIWAIPSLAARVVFKPPGDRMPRTSAGGASRTGPTCGINSSNSSQENVTPILPRSNIGLTVAEHPTIFIYIPKTKAKTAFFSLEDANEKNIYQGRFDLPQQAGIMQIKLPSSIPELKTEQKYKWSLAMICTADLEPDSPFISGWIRRVSVNHNSRNLQANLDSVANLAASGLWYDVLSTLAQLRHSQPNNPALVTTWQDLLNSVGLNAIANEPLIN
ncbi:DUF928 domain-containing protein [Calothrix sp. UHCC 0171]|uniref:DUF928 domain-containing protein n=1 Tax=Calothrix sp. UHCC 0171 TaxID=3110245 RepID=UPI002B1F0685|nr:DUF928 domain-containing protein [Calothrix sp. UHCC 0171]MEA5570041.1 DUF928 domain-containing protein [Calothrix sp. UHCC 0171]